MRTDVWAFDIERHCKTLALCRSCIRCHSMQTKLTFRANDWHLYSYKLPLNYVAQFAPNESFQCPEQLSQSSNRGAQRCSHTPNTLPLNHQLLCYRTPTGERPHLQKLMKRRRKNWDLFVLKYFLLFEIIKFLPKKICQRRQKYSEWKIK